MTKRYAKRDPRNQGGLFEIHMGSMTAEDLHDKADIAKELAHRDLEIAVLREALHKLVLLKDHRERHGKDAWYQNTMPGAWEKAREVLGQ